VSSFRNVLLAAAVVGLSFSTSEAEARFGKRSSSGSSSSKKEKKSKVHDASAVGQGSSSSDDGDDGKSSSASQRTEPNLLSLLSLFAAAPSPEPAVRTYYVASRPAPALVGELPATAPTSTAPTSGVAQEPAAEVHAAPEKLGSNIRLGVDGAALGGGAGVTLFLAFEGDRMGLDVRGTGLTLPTDDGTSGNDNITLANLHLTYALVARDNLRVRLEGGLAGAQAPDLSVAGPSIALSLEGCLLPILDVELRAQATAFPYQQLDAQAALALRLQALVVRGGWRGLYLNDNGLVDGVEHADAFGGPFLGAGFTF
jgi:hypothetical protein